MKNLKNTESISPRFKATLEQLDEFIDKNKIISKLTVFGPSIMNPAYIESDEAELYLAVFFDEESAKSFKSKDYTRLTCRLEHEIPFVLTYAIQDTFAYKQNGQLQEDIKKGIVIFERT